ncbi:MAG: HAMP domain-containing protein [Solirubrobacterales bacterium]|nr:HAMP domain-containing protein [Solirubrobacterales bacterium]
MGRGLGRLPPWTIRARLTLLYGAVFLITGAILLTVGYLLVRSNLNVRLNAAGELSVRPPPHGAGARLDAAIWSSLRNELISSTLHKLLRDYIGALILTTAVSVMAGWWLAGRALAPLRRITATAQRVSGENLGERISLGGPEDELRELADTFDRMLVRLDAAFASQRDFVANASHELRTPLTIMRTEVDVALADPDASTDELRGMGEAVRETIDRSEALVAALLMLARSETVSVAEVAVDLAELAGDCVTDLHRRAKAAGVEIVTDLGPAVAAGDPALLERLLANLIDNGIRYNVPEGGRLEVVTATLDGRAEVRVANTGPVIAPDKVGVLTEPFQRVSRGGDGFGLGLSIVASVVRAHDGDLSVVAPETGGLEVTARFAADSRSAVPADRTLMFGRRGS